MKRLPPLSTLPVLEAAARLQSFSAAATRLQPQSARVSRPCKHDCDRADDLNASGY